MNFSERYIYDHLNIREAGGEVCGCGDLAIGKDENGQPACVKHLNSFQEGLRQLREWTSLPDIGEESEWKEFEETPTAKSLGLHSEENISHLKDGKWPKLEPEVHDPGWYEVHAVSRDRLPNFDPDWTLAVKANSAHHAMHLAKQHLYGEAYNNKIQSDPFENSLIKLYSKDHGFNAPIIWGKNRLNDSTKYLRTYPYSSSNGWLANAHYSEEYGGLGGSELSFLGHGIGFPHTLYVRREPSLDEWEKKFKSSSKLRVAGVLEFAGPCTGSNCKTCMHFNDKISELTQSSETKKPTASSLAKAKQLRALKKKHRSARGK
jgi:hypothetical protein